MLLKRLLPRRYRGQLKKIYRFLKFIFAWLLLKNSEVSNINLFEFGVYAKSGEDGIIKIIFHKIKTTNKFFVEFGVEDGKECNTRLLREKHGWQGLSMDSGEDNPSFIKKEFITAENINELFGKYNVPKHFDLLSIDIDFNDYWVWKAIQDYQPRAVVIEYNSSVPPTESKVIEYDPHGQWDRTNYFGASLLAMVKLGRLKGYTLVGCNRRGVNAFFVKNDLADGHFKVKTTRELYRPPGYGKKVNGVHIGHPQSSKPMISVGE